MINFHLSGNFGKNDFQLKFFLPFSKKFFFSNKNSLNILNLLTDFKGKELQETFLPFTVRFKIFGSIEKILLPPLRVNKVEKIFAASEGWNYSLLFDIIRNFF